MTKKLSDICKALKSENIDFKTHLQYQKCNLDNIEVNGAVCDSRLVKKGQIFIAKGDNFKMQFLNDALDRGASSFLFEGTNNKREFLQIAKEKRVACIECSNIRRSMAIVSKEAYSFNNQDMVLVGITGTKGKTTVSTFVFDILREVKQSKVGFIGTHKVFDGKSFCENDNTTPEPPELFGYLSKMKQNGCEYCVMEVSSQALKYERVFGLEFEVSAITNIGIDHISPVEHPNLEDYVQSKFKLVNLSKKLVLNKYLSLNKDVEDEILKCECDALAKFKGEVVYFEYQGEQIDIALGGQFNQQNAQCALKICELLDGDEALAKKALKNSHVDGRMEVSTSKDGKFTCIVDYAHTKDSYELFFNEVKKNYPHAYIGAVFGASGGKASARCSELPSASVKFADLIMITSDDPGSENPKTVVDRVFENLERAKSNVNRDVQVAHEVNRNKAIEIAFDNLKELILKNKTDEVVLCLLGKGSESECVCADGNIKIIPDSEMAKRIVKEYDKAIPKVLNKD